MFQTLKCNELKHQEEDFYKTDIEDSWNGQYFDGYLWWDKDTYWRLFASLFSHQRIMFLIWNTFVSLKISLKDLMIETPSLTCKISNCRQEADSACPVFPRRWPRLSPPPDPALVTAFHGARYAAIAWETQHCTDLCVTDTTLLERSGSWKEWNMKRTLLVSKSQAHN